MFYKINYMNKPAASSDFAVVSRKMIVYTGNLTFAIAI